MHVLNGLWERTRLDALCLAGGCAMNSVANGKIRATDTPFTSVYIQPAAGDNGTALGAAYHVWHETLGTRASFMMEHGYWGTPHDVADVIGSVPRWRRRLERTRSRCARRAPTRRGWPPR